MTHVRKRHRAAEPAGDYGPRARLDNGTAILTYRADPDKPNAPAIRGAAAYVAYDALWSDGVLTDTEREAADRIVNAVEAETGARWGQGSSAGGLAHWERGGPTPLMLQASADLRALREVLDAATHDAVIRLVCNGQKMFHERAKVGLAAMARHWQME
jgi:hypothetical protein